MAGPAQSAQPIPDSQTRLTELLLALEGTLEPVAGGSCGSHPLYAATPSGWLQRPEVRRDPCPAPTAPESSPRCLLHHQATKESPVRTGVSHQGRCIRHQTASQARCISERKELNHSCGSVWPLSHHPCSPRLQRKGWSRAGRSRELPRGMRDADDSDSACTCRPASCQERDCSLGSAQPHVSPHAASFLRALSVTQRCGFRNHKGACQSFICQSLLQGLGETTGIRTLAATPLLTSQHCIFCVSSNLSEIDPKFFQSCNILT